MDNYKHICDLSYCKKNGKCIFQNAISVLKSNSYEVKLGREINSDIIICYQKEDIGLDTKQEPIKQSVIKNIEVTKSKTGQYRCENPKCKLGNPLTDIRHNNDINLCNNCNDLIHQWKTNHELAKHFNSKTKIIKLLGCIRELEKENNKDPKDVIRCINIYCGTELNITQHHLIPKPYRKGIEGRIERVYLCDDCHKQVHRIKTNGQLAKEYNTREAIIKLLAENVPFRVQRMINVSSNRFAMVA